MAKLEKAIKRERKNHKARTGMRVSGQRDLCDIVREHDEEEDWLDDADDYLNCDFEE
jgi:hypothetical protein